MKPPAISLLLPTRGRPALALRFFESVVTESCKPDAVEIVLYVDEDDVQSHALNNANIAITKIIGPRTTMGACNTACLQRSSGEIIILMNDDVVIRTPGWDDRIRALHSGIGDGIYLAYGNDLFKGKSLCSFPILSRRACEALGDPFPADYKGAFIDYHLFDIFKRLEHHGLQRIFYLPHIIFEHMHHRAGKGHRDRTYLERDRFGDDDTFLKLSARRRATAFNLRRAIAAPREDAGGVASHVPLMSTSPWSSANYLIFDGDLPLLWRLRLFTWFLQRALARHVILVLLRKAKRAG